MRTSYLSCIALVVMLSTAMPSLASSYASASADSGIPYDYEQDTVISSYVVWEPGIYYYCYSLSVSARAMIRGVDPAGSSAFACAYAGISGLVNDSRSADASVYGVLDGDSDADSYSSDTHTADVEVPGCVLVCYEECCASAACGDASAQAHANASASASASIW